MFTKATAAAVLTASVSAVSTFQINLFLQENLLQQQPTQLYTPFA